MSGTDIFVAILSVVMFFGGLYLNVTSRKLADQYAESHRPEPVVQKGMTPKAKKVQKK